MRTEVGQQQRQRTGDGIGIASKARICPTRNGGSKEEGKSSAWLFHDCPGYPGASGFCFSGLSFLYCKTKIISPVLLPPARVTMSVKREAGWEEAL